MNDPFEETLAKNEMIAPPSDWKGDILGHAAAPRRKRISPLHLAIACCWLLIGVLRLATPQVDDEQIARENSKPTSTPRLSSIYLVAALTRDTNPND